MIPGKKLASGSEQKPGRVKLARIVNASGEYRDAPPRKHDAGSPLSDAPALGDNGTRNFEPHVGDEEKARA